MISYLVTFQNRYGLVSKLADKYSVSRQFIYQEKSKFEKYIHESDSILDNGAAHTKRSCIEEIISLRMVAKSSIIGISEHLSCFKKQFRSVGFISQVLQKAGRLIGSKVTIDISDPLTIPICCDEIFAGNTPILVTVEPQSLMMIDIQLSDNRKSEAWIAFWEHTASQGIHFASLTNDDGLAMQSAKEVFMPETERQRDTFHALSHRLGLIKMRFEEAAYKAIGHEYHSEYLLENAKSETAEAKRKLKYRQAKLETQKAIELYENFSFLYNCLLACFEQFDSKGNLKNVLTVVDDFVCGLCLLKTLDDACIDKQVATIERNLDELFYFYQTAQSVVNDLGNSIDADILRQFCSAWQCRKKMVKAKQTPRKNALRSKETQLLQIVKELLGDDFENVKKQIYNKLNSIIQSSALVECVNSIIRPYLNTCKNQPTQELLNLIMFYHNHRRFVAGERKGHTPWELITGNKQDSNWLELLMEKVQDKL